MYYFGYGMNTNPQGMAGRCPAAQALGRARLPDHEFRFSYHADILPAPGQSVEGVLWRVTDQCMARLDSLEGYPNYYTRKQVQVQCGGDSFTAWVYQMNPLEDGLPSDPEMPDMGYLQNVLEGYIAFGCDRDQIYRALYEAQEFQHFYQI
jgi:gamma-glutamylcyclotransferase (GGCT)/AIG2-like uncharacterized protein YtfP